MLWQPLEMKAISLNIHQFFLFFPALGNLLFGSATHRINCKYIYKDKTYIYILYVYKVYIDEIICKWWLINILSSWNGHSSREKYTSRPHREAWSYNHV